MRGKKNSYATLKIMDQKALIQSLNQLVRSASLARIQAVAKAPDFRVEELQSKNKVLAHWMALILISGKSLRLTFKTHFMSADAKQLASKSYGKKPDELKLAQASDFIAEFCNLTAGKIKKTLEDQNISTGISLPLLTRGFDELFFPNEDAKTTFKDQWALTTPNEPTQMSCSVLLQVYDFATLEKLKLSGDSAAIKDDGGVEFL